MWGPPRSFHCPGGVRQRSSVTGRSGLPKTGSNAKRMLRTRNCGELEREGSGRLSATFACRVQHTASSPWVVQSFHTESKGNQKKKNNNEKRNCETGFHLSPNNCPLFVRRSRIFRSATLLSTVFASHREPSYSSAHSSPFANSQLFARRWK